MKNLLSIFLGSILLMLSISSCTDKPPLSGNDIVVVAGNASDVPLLVENIVVKTETLVYHTGSIISFSGRIFDSKERGIAEVQVSIDDPVLLKTLLSAKTDKEGRFTYTLALPTLAKGTYTFVFYYKSAKISVTITIREGSAPGAPSNPKPENGAVNVSLNPVLSWTAKDPDGDPLKYAIYFGENKDAPKKISDQTGTEFKPGMLASGKTYYWKVVAFDGKDGETSGDWWSFTTEKSDNHPPGAPINPSPVNGAERAPLNPLLTWTAKDPDGDALKYVVYFGENTSAPAKVTDLKEAAFKPGPLTPGKKYYWKVVAFDGRGGETSGDWWSFTTETPNTTNRAPSAPTNPIPANGAINVSLNPVLGWSAKDPDGDALKYAIYFGESKDAPKKISDQTASEFKPGTLSPGKTYYWKVVAFDGKGGETSGDWWSFTTEKPANHPPTAPAIPSPANGAINVSLNPALYWSAKDPDGDVLKYVVYFGENTSAPAKVTDLTQPGFKPGTLTPGKTYYWRVVAFDGKGGETSSDWWSFTTEKPENHPPTAPSNPSPANGIERVSVNPVLTWSAKDPDGDALRYLIYFGDTPNTALKKVEQTSTEFKPGTLEPGKTYYWKVVAIDSKGAQTTGDIWSFTTVK